jgi:hypothetical protein
MHSGWYANDFTSASGEGEPTIARDSPLRTYQDWNFELVRPPGPVKRPYPFAFPKVNRFSMAVFYGMVARPLQLGPFMMGRTAPAPTRTGRSAATGRSTSITHSMCTHCIQGIHAERIGLCAAPGARPAPLRSGHRAASTAATLGAARSAPLPAPARGRLSALSVFLYKSILYGAFVWARSALNGRKRRFPARAERQRLRGWGVRLRPGRAPPAVRGCHHHQLEARFDPTGGVGYRGESRRCAHQREIRVCFPRLSLMPRPCCRRVLLPTLQEARGRQRSCPHRAVL